MSGPVRLLLAGSGPVAGAEVLQRLDAEPGTTVVRRCVDLGELLGAAAAGVGDVAVVDDQLRRFDRDAVATLHGHGVRVVLWATEQADGWHQLGVDAVVRVLDDVLPAVRAPHIPLPDSHAPSRPVAAANALGRLVAVWGPVGAPGRTSVAITVADELARRGATALLVDADTVGPSVGQHLGLLDDTSGLASLTRLAAHGRLRPEALARASVALVSGLHVLTGLTRPSRWPELRPASLDAVLATAVEHYRFVVVDVGATAAEATSAHAAGLGPPQREDVARTVLAKADTVLAVGRADPVGLARLARDLGGVADAAPAADMRVVVNRFRRGSLGPHPRAAVQAVLGERLAVVSNGTRAWVDVPDDPTAVDAALLAGRTLAEVAPQSLARRALLGLVDEMAPQPQRPHRTLRRPPAVWRRKPARVSR